MKFVARYQVIVDGKLFAECLTRAEADCAVKQASANPPREVECIRLIRPVMPSTNDTI